MPGRNSKLGFTVFTKFCTIKLRANGVNFWGGRVIHETTEGFAPEMDAIAGVKFIPQGVKDRPDLLIASLHILFSFQRTTDGLREIGRSSGIASKTLFNYSMRDDKKQMPVKTWFVV